VAKQAKNDFIEADKNLEKGFEISMEKKKKILKERADLLKMEVVKEEITGNKFEGLEFLLTNERYAIALCANESETPTP